MRSGIVTKTGVNGWAAVALNRGDACDECGESHCCGSLNPGASVVIKALNGINARQGDLVQLDYTPGAALKGAALYYIFMMVGLVLGAVMGTRMGRGLPLGEMNGAILFSIAGAILGLAVAGLLYKRKPLRDRRPPEIRRVIRKDAADKCGPNEDGSSMPPTGKSGNCTCTA